MKIEKFTDKMYERINKEREEVLSTEALNDIFEGSDCLDKALAVYNANKDALGGKKALKTAYREVIQPALDLIENPIEITSLIPITLTKEDCEDFDRLKNHAFNLPIAQAEDMIVAFKFYRNENYAYLSKAEANFSYITAEDLISHASYIESCDFNYFVHLNNINAYILNGFSFAEIALSLPEFLKNIENQNSFFQNDFLILMMDYNHALFLGEEYVNQKEAFMQKLSQQLGNNPSYFEKHIFVCNHETGLLTDYNVDTQLQIQEEVEDPEL